MIELIGGCCTKILDIHSNDESPVLPGSLTSAFHDYGLIRCENHFICALSRHPELNPSDCLQPSGDHFEGTTLHHRSISPSCWNITVRHCPGDSEVQITTGRYGIRPVYYYLDGDDFLYSTDYSALLKLVIGHTLDRSAAVSLLAFGRIIDNRTLSTRIRRLPARGQHIYTDGGIIHEEIKHPAIHNTKIHEVRDCFMDLLQTRIKRHDTVHIPLSGGVDSRTIAAAASGTRCFCYTRGPKNSPEVSMAAEVAARSGLMHRHFPFPDNYLRGFVPAVTAMTGGLVSMDDCHAIHPCNQLGNGEYAAVVPGTGGEIGRGFWGYCHGSKIGASPESITQRIHNQENLLKRYPILAESAGKELNALEEIYLSNYMYAAEGAPEHDPTIWNDEFYMQDRLPNFTAYGPMIWNRFFDVILPFLEDEYLDALRGLPPEKRDRPHVHRAIIEKGAGQLSDLRLVPSGSRFSALFDDGKPGFWDWKPVKKMRFRSYRKQPAQNYDGWLRAESDFVAEILNDTGSQLWEIIPQEHALKLFRRHLMGRNTGKLICRIMTIAMSERLIRTESADSIHLF